MAERRPDLAREHRLHDRFRGPPRASPVRFQVSRPADRTSRGWAREGCLWPNAASQGRPPDGSGGESERSTQNGRAKTLSLVWWWWWWWWWQQLRITSGRLPRIWGSIANDIADLPASRQPVQGGATVLQRDYAQQRSRGSRRRCQACHRRRRAWRCPAGEWPSVDPPRAGRAPPCTRLSGTAMRRGLGQFARSTRRQRQSKLRAAYSLGQT